MNVFEDLIVELKQENLLESTVIDDQIADGRFAFNDEDASSGLYVSSEGDDGLDESIEDGVAISSIDDLSSSDVAENTSHNSEVPADASAPLKVTPGKEFFKKRAVGEVSSLQMVEHIITAVEREYLKIIPSIFDDLEVKKALHAFVQSLEGDDGSDQASAEFALMKETESWCSALAARDKNIPVTSLRLYCENARPALSSQAMLAIAKFYRNLPYSELVRAKFDYVMTRLFTKTGADHTRSCLFDRAGMLDHINSLYSDWSSVPLYSAEDDESRIMLAALSLDDLSREAESSSSFDQLTASDYFVRLRMFKESITEVFLAPEVTAAAIEANVRIGNAYVALLARERAKLDADRIEQKYADLDNATISDAAGQTLDLADLLKRSAKERKSREVLEAGASADEDHKNAENLVEAFVAENVANPWLKSIIGQFLGMSRWVTIFSGIMIATAIGIWLWADLADEQLPDRGVVSVDFSGSPMAEYVKTAKVSSGMLYAQMLPTWDALLKDKREAVLQKMLQEGAAKGYTQVTIIAKDGKNSGYASANRVEANMP